MKSLDQKLTQLKLFKFKEPEAGYAADSESFVEQIVLPQFGDREVIRKLHNEVMNYVNTEAPVFFLRAYGSFPKDKYQLLRRGFLSRYKNEVEYVFCDNSFAAIFTAMKSSGVVFSSAEIKEYFKKRNVLCGFLQTSLESELSSFSRVDAIKSNLNNAKWYLAHIHPVGANYDGFLFSKKRDEYFPVGDRREWANKEKVRTLDRIPTEQEFAILKAHYIRLTHPLNNFIVPNSSILKYNGGTRLGEESELIYKVHQRLKSIFPSEYAQMEEVIFKTNLPLLSKTSISNIRWGKPNEAQDMQNAAEPVMPQKTIRNKARSGTEEISPSNVKELLRKMGKEAFLNYFLALQSGIEVDETSLATENPRSMEWKTKAFRYAIGKTIFKNGLEREALQIIVNSKKLRPELIQLAERYQDQLANEPENSEQSVEE